MKVKLTALLFGLCLIFGAPLAAIAGPASSTVDTDGDGIGAAFDNCTSVSNAAQADADHNGCGDACTANISCDGNGDLIIGTPDLSGVIATLGNSCANAEDPACAFDCNGDLIIGTPDLSAVIGQLGNTVGPSGITNVQCDPGTCRCTPN